MIRFLRSWEGVNERQRQYPRRRVVDENGKHGGNQGGRGAAKGGVSGNGRPRQSAWGSCEGNALANMNGRPGAEHPEPPRTRKAAREIAPLVRVCRPMRDHVPPTSQGTMAGALDLTATRAPMGDPVPRPTDRPQRRRLAGTGRGPESPSRQSKGRGGEGTLLRVEPPT